MPNYYKDSSKYCGACMFWGGTRKIDKNGRYADVSSSTAKGECNLQGGPWKGQDAFVTNTCNKWQAWGVLK